MFETLARVLIFFGFIALGLLLVRLKRLDRAGLDGLSAYFYWLGFPAFLIVSFSQLPAVPAAQAPAMTATLLSYSAAMIVSAAIVIVLVRLTKGRADFSIAAGMASFINNSAFLGIPIALSLFGTEATRTGPLVVACDFLILFSLGCAALAKASGHTVKQALTHTARNPTVIAALIGVGLLCIGFRFPPLVETPLEMLGKSGPPVALVALGGMLGLLPKGTLTTFDPVSFIAILGKTLLAPACVAIALVLLHTDPTIFKVCVFLSACPTAVSVFIQTKMYGLWFEGAAATVAQSTLVSLITLSGLALLLTHVG